MKELRELAAAVVGHIRETLQAPLPADLAEAKVILDEMLEALGDVEKALEQKDEREALRELVALSEALDLSIPDDQVGEGLDADDDELEGGDDDDDAEEDTKR